MIGQPNEKSRPTLRSIASKAIMIFFAFILTKNSFSQANISIQDFETTPGTPTMTFSNTGGGFVTGNSGAGDLPANQPLYAAGSRAWGITNGTSTLTFMNNSGLGSCTSKYFEFRLASWSVGSSSNGADAADIVTVEISLDGGTTWSSELRVLGNSNASWSYTSGTGTASTTYDGNNTPTNFQPGGGGSRTTDGYSTVRVNLPNSCTQARIRITMLNNATGERWTIDNVRLVATCPVSCTPDSEPTTNASGITVSPGCTSAQINFTGGNGANAIIVMSTTCPITATPTDQVNYNSSSTFGSGSTVGAGNFVVYNGAAGSTIVSGLTSGQTYCFKIFEYNGTAANCTENYLTSGVASTSFTTSAACSTPEIRAILVNACTAVEGFDEMVFITNGNSALSIGDMEITYPSGGTFCNSGCGALTLGNNASYINSLNTLAGCTLFYYADPIPAGATIVVFTGQNPTMTFDYSSECPGGGPYYVVFSNNTTDNSGRFANDAGAARTLSIDFGTSSDAVTYISNNANTGDDGDFVSFTNAGVPSYGNFGNCAVVLPVEWGSAYIETKGNSGWINWNTQSELNNDYFVIEYALHNGDQFKEIGRVKSKGNSSTQQSYQFALNELQERLYYFRIRQVDLNGESSYSQILTAEIYGSLLKLTYADQLQDVTKLVFNRNLVRNSQLYVHDIYGKKIYETTIENETNSIIIPELLDGMMMISTTHPFRPSEIVKAHFGR